ncbi:aliphatic sulfonate ABC transporter substrate-binding protein [Sporolactobacillus shoreae]|uniref:Aliphatic sulfonate ABC transporter substrate-binding protein n=1 Tax=Sporolactobacillus shoreae TaxID=1465501 RepID=A0A4Z0GMP1_9BACL|nr:ABC transporter substrate-binding protein [Sporolactobacillus shoreae]TGA98304.1 aliphatic sulfonate ABC transporter substrate-binding protein [Sporolactobacillus shoreae]
MKHLKLTKVLSVLMACFMVLALTACGSSSSKGSGSPSSSGPIKLAFSPLPTWYFWYLVQDKGFFKKHHVNVKLVYFPTYSDSISALNTGKVDGNSEALIDCISPLSKGIPIKSVFATDYSAGGDGIVAKPGIKTVKDLKGKKVATEVGTIEHFFLLTVLKDNGMTEKDINLTNMTVQDSGNAFIANKLDAAALWEPFLSEAQTKGNGTKIASSKSYPGLIPDMFVMNSKVMQQRPEDVKNIAAAWFDAMNYYKAHPAESIKIVAKAAGITPAELKQGLDGFHLLSPSANKQYYKKGNTFQSFYYSGEQNGKFLKSLGYIQKVPSFNDFLNSPYIK